MLPTHPFRTAALAALVPAAVLLAGCSAPAPTAPAAPAPAAATADAHGGGHSGGSAGGSGGGHAGHGDGGLSLNAVQSGPLGVVTTEGDGRLVYMNTADTPTTSTCTGACAEEWLPLLVVEGREPELLGVDEELVGTLSRPEGEQLTLAGHPLYHRADDSGTLTEADFEPHRRDGRWFVITPEGEPIA